MSGYLRRLAARSLGTADVARPIIPPLYSDWRRQSSMVAGGQPSGGPLEVEEFTESPPARLPAVWPMHQSVPRSAHEPSGPPSTPPTSRTDTVTPPSGAPAETALPVVTKPEHRPARGSRPLIADPTPTPRRAGEEAGPIPAAPVRRVTAPASPTVGVPPDMPPPRPVPVVRDRTVDSTGSTPERSDRRHGQADPRPSASDRPALLALAAPSIEAPPAGPRRARSESGAGAPWARPAAAPMAEERTVEITIGRIEIRALPGAAPAASPPVGRRTTMSLEAYLHARAREGLT